MLYRFNSVSLLFLFASMIMPSWAQTSTNWPNKPVKIVTAFAAGSASDIVARLLASELQAEMGQSFVVENKPGASGIIAAEMVAKSPADGYTLMLTTNTINSGNPHLFTKLPYDALKDFTPIARICNFIFVLAVAADSPIKSVSDLINWSSTNPNKVSFAYGNSTGQIAGAALNNLVGLNALAVPYKSTPQALTALVGGEVTYLFVDLASSQALLKAGRMRALAISSANKSNLVPDLMPLANMPNLQGFDLAAWVGVIGPAGMPADITAKLSASINRMLARKEIIDRLTGMGADVFPGTSSELSAYMGVQYIAWRDKIKSAGIKPE
ncbi:MAG: tripartite tricarboxylate transporter substrate-binding protein [Betaproteobacteria bacterium]